MGLSYKQLKAFVKSPQGKQLIAQAKKLDTPENREKAKALVTELRTKAAPVAKEAATKAATAAKAARAKGQAPARKPQGGAPPPPA